jgi:hypothetical protein
MVRGLARAHFVAREAAAFPQQSLAERDRERRAVGGDVGRHRQRCVTYLPAGQRAGGETDGRGLLAVEQPAGEEELGGARVADGARDRPVRVRVGQDAAPHVGEAELRLARHQADVALHRQRQADADGVAVDRGDHRLAHLPGGKRDRIGAEVGLLAPLERRGPGGQVGADAERRPGAGEHHRPHRVVRVAGAVGRRQ